MTDTRENCSEGWDPAELLAYLEGGLKPDDVRILEEHLRTCHVCSAELESLRRVDLLLKRHPESFHPDKEELYRLASTGEDAQSKIEAHVRSCPTCEEEMEILREMIALRESRDVTAIKLPAALAQEFERIHGAKDQAERSEGRLRTWWGRLLEIPNSLPIMTLGTAAAVLIVALFAVPLWRSYVEQSLPETAAVPAPSAPKPAESPTPAQQPASEGEERAPLGLSQDSKKHKMLEKQEAGQAVEAGNKQARQKLEAPKSNQPTVEGLMQKEAPAKGGRSLGEKGAPVASPLAALQRNSSHRAVGQRPETASHMESQEDRDRVSRIGETDRQKLEKKTDERQAASGLADATTKTPIEVWIVDVQGRDVEGITFVPPEDKRFTFRRGIVEDEKDKAPAKSAAGASKDRKAGERIIIRVTGEGGNCDLDGQLFYGDSTVPEKTIKLERVAKDDLTLSIRDLVSSLIASR